MLKFGNKTIITEALHSLRDCRPTFVTSKEQKEAIIARLEPYETLKVVRISDGYIWIELEFGDDRW